MEREAFEHAMAEAKTMQRLENHDYWMGKQRGLRRRFHGENFGTEDEHELWMASIDSDDESRSARGRGYRDGYIPEYCTQNDGDCSTCSLVNYARDCQNNPI